MNCVKCGSPTPYTEPSLCSACEDEAIANAAIFKRLFVDSNIAKDSKLMFEEVEP